MRNYARIERYITEDTALRYVCPCKFKRTFDTAAQFEAASEHDVFVSKSPLFIDCPQCHYQYPAKIAKTIRSEDRPATVFDEVHLIGVLSEDRELDVTLIDCDECGTPIKPGDRGEGPEHPVVGWEYYECSCCSAAYSPQDIEVKTDEKYE
jgi:DNA-directed RNA polymerase subunit M/transcription elongation factor TFIIS